MYVYILLVFTDDFKVLYFIQWNRLVTSYPCVFFFINYIPKV